MMRHRDGIGSCGYADRRQDPANAGANPLMKVAVESYRDVLPEMLPLYPLHHAEASPNTDKPEGALAMRFDIYDALANDIALVTLREDGILVGYCLVFVAPGLHTRHCLTGSTDLLFVHPAVRGRFGGMRLIRAMRDELKRRGVHRWAMGVKNDLRNGLGRMLELNGFRAEETGYSIWLGGLS